jgi:hypothetical protein
MLATHAYLLPWNNESWMSPLTDAGVSEVRCPSAKTTKRWVKLAGRLALGRRIETSTDQCRSNT